MSDRLPSLGDQFRACLDDMQAAETKQDAKEAAEPLLALTAMYGQAMDEGDRLTDMTILKVSRVTQLTEEEVEGEIEALTWEFVDTVANE